MGGIALMKGLITAAWKHYGGWAFCVYARARVCLCGFVRACVFVCVCVRVCGGGVELVLWD